MVRDIQEDTEHYFCPDVQSLHPDTVSERHVHLVARNPCEEAWPWDKALVVRKEVIQ